MTAVKKVILIADDDDAVRNMLGRLLESENYSLRQGWNAGALGVSHQAL